MCTTGGFGENDMTPQSVLACDVCDLLQSAVLQHQSLGSRLTTAWPVHPSPDSHTLWQEMAELPVDLSTLVTLQGQLLAVGGRYSGKKPTSAVHQYDRTTNAWKKISHMKTKRYHCMAVVLPGNRLMVVGGSMERKASDSVEVATLV